MKVESITSAVSSLALAFGEGASAEKTMSRPFGVALLFAGLDKKGPRYVLCKMRKQYSERTLEYYCRVCLAGQRLVGQIICYNIGS